MTIPAKNIACLILFTLSVSFTSYSQPKILQSLKSFPSSERYVVANWNSNTGLPQNSVSRIAQDKNGLIWLATYGGLVRFDGSKFKVFSVKSFPKLHSDRIISVFVDSKNRVWISTETGKIVYFDGKEFHDFSPNLNSHFNVVYNFNEDSSGNIYIKTDSTLFYYSDGKAEPVKFYVDGKLISKIVLYETSPTLRNDTLFVSGYHTLSLVYRGKHVKSINANKPSYFNYSLLANRDGYWFINFNNLYYSKTFDGIPDAKNILPDKQFTKVINGSNSLLANTITDGIVLVKKDFTIEKIFSYPQISSSYRTALFIDSENNWWIGTELNGLYYVKKKFLYTLNKSYGLTEFNTYAIFKSSDKSIWIGQNPGFICIADGKIINWKNVNNFWPPIWGITEDKDKNFWIATNGVGLFRLKENKLEDLNKHTSNITGANFFSIYRDSKDRIWAGSIGAITKYEDGKFSFYTPFNDRKNIYRNILEDKSGALWFASDAGLIKYHQDKFTMIDSINARYARSLYIDRKNRLWVGTYGNGIKIKVNEKYFHVGYKNGLFSDIVSATVEDYKGNFWFTCNNGIFRIRESEIDEYLAGKRSSVTSLNYGIEEGLENIEFNGGCQPNWMRDDDGNLWFPSFSGPVIVDVNSLKSPVRNSIVLIDNLVYKDSIFHPGDDIYLPSDYTSFTVNIIAPSFSSQSNTRLMYRLLGNSDEWINIGNKREIVFQKLPYGSYKLQVVASDSYGNWNAVPASIKFYVEANLYETPFFYILISLLALSTIIYFFYLRLQLARKTQRKLELIVEERTNSLRMAKEEAEKAAGEEKVLRSSAEEENRQKIELLRIVSHDLKNPLGAIHGFVDILLEDGELNDGDKQTVIFIQEAADRIKELITQLLNFSRFEGDSFKVVKTSISVKPFVEKILERFKSAIEKKKQLLTKDFYIDGVTIYADELLFSQIIENLISNAIKYSPIGKEIIVSLREDENNVFILVKDFGQGFSEVDKLNLYKPFVKLSSTPTGGELSSGLGLTIVKKFVELSDGAIHLESQKGVGSQFILEFKKQKES